MVMPARTRSRRNSGYQGTVIVGGFTFNKHGWDSIESISDFVGNPKGQNSLAIHSAKRVAAPTFNGQYGLWLANSLRPSCSYNFPVSDSWYGSMPYSRTVLEAIKGSHPGSPTVSIPNALYELKELPGMLQNYAKIVRKIRDNPDYHPGIRDGSNEWLAYNFGWKPLYNDLKSLFDVAEGAKRQARRYAKAKSEGFVSTRGLRGGATKVSVSNGTFDSSMNSVFATVHKEAQSKAWTSARWTATDNLPLYTILLGGNRNLLLDQLGLDASFDTVWNAVPWTWLIDWCTDVSALVSVYSNTGGFRFSSAVSMEHVKQTHTYVPTSNRQNWPTEVVISYESKLRTVVAPSIADVRLTILNKRQLSILAALVFSNQRRIARR
jgi:hypothetical protein